MDLVLQHCCWEGEGFLSSLSGLLLSWLHHSTSKKHGPGLLKAVKHMLKPFQHSSEPRIVLKGGVFLSHLNKNHHGNKESIHVISTRCHRSGLA